MPRKSPNRHLNVSTIAPAAAGHRLRTPAIAQAASGLRLTALAIALAASAWVDAAFAADHNEAPGAMADPAADIADVYAWHSGSKLITAVTFAGIAASATAPLYDDDVLYTVHIDNDNDYVPDHDVYVRFGQKDAGDWGVQVQNLPGSTGNIEGPVGTTINAGGGRMVYAGWREDPFFFDLEGFRTTLMTSALSFDNQRDFFEDRNVTAIVLEMDLAAARGTGTKLNVWATTARK